MIFKEIRYLNYLFGFIISLFLSIQTFAQNLERINVFINCQVQGNKCFEDYLITELNLFKFVRDRSQSEIEILFIDQIVASEGLKYTLTINGFSKFSNTSETFTLYFKPAETEFIIREKILSALKIKLLPFMQQTAWSEYIIIQYPHSDQISNVKKLEKDKWNNWVFTIGNEGNFNGESNRFGFNAEAYFNSSKITQSNKFIFDSWFENRFNSVTIDGNKLSASVQNYGVDMYYVRSINEHFSIGGFSSILKDNFRNIKSEYRFAPTIEYNFYRYSENVNKQLRLGYQVGFRQFSYFDTTVFNRLNEYRSYHQLSLVSNFTMPWGRLSGVIQANTFLDNWKQNRFSLNMNGSIRVAEGFNIILEGSVSIVNNQISLQRKQFSNEIYLLNAVQLPTNFLFNFRFGFNFTFGSTNNSIINPRFENLD